MLVTPPHTNAAEVTGKIIQEVTTASVINRVDPYIWLNSKSAWFGQVTSEFWPLITATSKQNPCADIQDSTRLCWSFSIKQTPTFASYSPLNVHLVFSSLELCVYCVLLFFCYLRTNKDASLVLSMAQHLRFKS